MQINDFDIGLNFYMGDQWWRCTDVGTRTIVAIKHINKFNCPIVQPGIIGIEESYQHIDKTGTAGIAEHVIDEDDMEACSLETSDDG